MESILDGEEDPAPTLPRQDQPLEDDGGPWSDAFGVGSRVVEETHGDSNPMDVDDDPAFFEALLDAYDPEQEEQEEQEFAAALEQEEQNMQARVDSEEWFDTEEDGWEAALAVEEHRLTQVVIDIDEMQDNIVGGSTRRGYTDNSLHFMRWCIVHKPLWVIEAILLSVEGLRSRERGKQTKEERFKQLCRNATIDPILNYT
jgi:hypothetical protein